MSRLTFRRFVLAVMRLKQMKTGLKGKLNNNNMNLGKIGKDKITGFSGNYAILPLELREGKPLETHWFDVSRVEIVCEGVSIESVSDEKKSGGPQPVPYGNG